MNHPDPSTPASTSRRSIGTTWTTATIVGAVLVIGGAILAFPVPLTGAAVTLLGLLLVLGAPLLQRCRGSETVHLWHALGVSAAIVLLLGNLALSIQGRPHAMASLPILIVVLAQALRRRREQQ